MKRHEIKMTEGGVYSKLIFFAVPLMLSGILQLLYNAADMIVVGRYDGYTALAAVGSTSSLINLLINLFIGYSSGAGVIISRCFGANDEKGTKRAVGTCINMSFIFGIVLLFVGFFASRPMLQLMGSPDDVIDKATLYMKIYFLGMPASMVYNFGSSALRAVGDTKRPLKILTISGIINVAFNLVFVIVFKMGVAGVAIATDISQVISAVYILICLAKTEASYKIDLKRFKIHKKEFIQMTKIGLPAGIQSSLFSISNVIVQSAVNSFGSTVVAGNAAGANIGNFVYAVLNAISQAALTFVGQNYGAGYVKRIKKGIISAEVLQFSIVTFVSMIVVFFSRALLSIYVDDSAVIEVGTRRILIIIGTYCICGINEVFVSTLRGLGSSLLPMIISVFGICIFRIVFISTYFQSLRTLDSLYLTYPVSWLLTGIANGLLLIILWKRLTSHIKRGC